MSDIERLDLHQAFADDMSMLVHSRIASATSLEVLSERGDKLLQVVEDNDGHRFVTRSYAQDGVRYIEHRGQSFQEAWDTMHDIFTDVGIEVLPSSLLQSSGEYPFIVVSEYLPDGLSVGESPTEVKKSIAHSLGQLLYARTGYLPSPEMINQDMIQVVQQKKGEPRVLMIDTDPLIIKKPGRDRGADMLIAHYIERLGDLFWDRWCDENERGAVIGSLVRSLSDYMEDNLDPSTLTGTALMNLHMMSQGLNPRDMGFLR